MGRWDTAGNAVKATLKSGDEAAAVIAERAAKAAKKADIDALRAIDPKLADKALDAAKKIEFDDLAKKSGVNLMEAAKKSDIDLKDMLADPKLQKQLDGLDGDQMLSLLNSKNVKLDDIMNDNFLKARVLDLDTKSFNKLILDSDIDPKLIIKDKKMNKKFMETLADPELGSKGDILNSLKNSKLGKSISLEDFSKIEIKVSKMPDTPSKLKVDVIDDAVESADPSMLKKFKESHPKSYDTLVKGGIGAAGLGTLMLVTGTTSPGDAIKEFIKFGAETAGEAVAVAGSAAWDGFFKSGDGSVIGSLENVMYIGIALLLIYLVSTMT